MNMERLYDCIKPRHRVWCRKEELKSGTAEGTFTFVDSTIDAKLGGGSEIIVIDQPGTILFWDETARLAYDWTTDTESTKESTGEGGTNDEH